MPNDMPPAGSESWIPWIIEHLWMALAAVGAWVFHDLHKRLVALEAERGLAAEQRAVSTAKLDAIDSRTKRIEQLLDAQYRYSLSHNRGDLDAQN